MTEQDIADLGSAFASYLRRYRICFLQKRTAAHFDTYCRGLLSDLPRKSVEPIALEAGTVVRTLQEFLVTARWGHEQVRDLLQQHLAEVLAMVPDDPLGTIGVLDETSCQKWGDQTPGVQRQYLSCLGRIENGIITVHIGVAKNRYQALLDADLYLPQSWDADRQRCRAAGIPDELRYRPKWRIALDQLLRLRSCGFAFNWLAFDEDYSEAMPLLEVLNQIGQQFVAEVPVNFNVAEAQGGPTQRVDQRLSTAQASDGKQYRLPLLQSAVDSRWHATTAMVWVGGWQYLLIAAINEATSEVKHFLANALDVPVPHLLAVALRSQAVAQGLHLGKQQVGLLHYEGRDYTGLMRHLILALVVFGFVATQSERLPMETSVVAKQSWRVLKTAVWMHHRNLRCTVNWP